MYQASIYTLVAEKRLIDWQSSLPRMHHVHHDAEKGHVTHFYANAAFIHSHYAVIITLDYARYNHLLRGQNPLSSLQPILLTYRPFTGSVVLRREGFTLAL